MNRRFSIHPDAQLEFFEIVEWYEEHAGNEQEFIDEFEHIVRLIFDYPEGFQILKKRMRQVPMNRFPYVILYTEEAATIEIYRIIHTSRHPGKRVRKK